MAEGDAVVYNNFKEQLLLKQIDMVNDTLKVALCTSSYTFTKDGASLAYSDISTYEIVATGYTAGGASLAGKTVAQDDTNDRASFDANDLTWTSLAAASPKHAVLYDDTTATKHLMIHWELATDSNGGNYTLQWNALGLLLLT